jgi:hypothetical protein
MEAVPAGSWLAIFHPASDILTDQIAAVARHVSVSAASPTTLRARAEILRFFDGLELLEPGPGPGPPVAPGLPGPDMGEEVPGYAGLARKP